MKMSMTVKSRIANRTILKRLVDSIRSPLAEVPESFYKDLFGDHVRVTVTREGTIETEEYQHDFKKGASALPFKSGI